jgi:cytoskeletal protein CcmA (bactofilin family)
MKMGAERAIFAADEQEPQDIKVEKERPAPPCLLVTGEGDHGPALEPAEEEIRLRSQQIWQREGCPEGHAQDHWERARAELAALMEKTSNAQLAERPADDAAQTPIDTPEPAAESTPAPDLQAEVLSDGAEKEPEVLPVQVSLPRDEPVCAAPPPLRLPPVRRTAQSAVVPTIICAGIVLRGTLESAGDIHFNGGMDGDIRCAGLAVDEAAVIQGEIVADEVTVRGRIQGRIRAHKVLLCAGSRVEGDILYGTLAIESGAQLDGSFQQEMPLAH